MTYSECHDRPLPQSLIDLSRHSSPHLPKTTMKVKDPRAWMSYLSTGGLPGICFQRNSKLRATRFKMHLETLLERDFALISQSNLPKMTLLAILTILAKRQGLPLDWTQLRRDTGVSVITLKKVFAAFDGLFLIRPVLAHDKSTIDTYFFEDQGTASYLAGFDSAPTLTDFVRFLYANLREQFHYQPALDYQVSSYRTRGGAVVPLVFNSENRSIGIVAQFESHPTLSAVRSAESFLRQNKNSKVIIVTEKGDSTKIHDRLYFMPWTALVT